MSIQFSDIVINALEAVVCLWFIYKKFGEGKKTGITALLFVCFTLELTIASYYVVPIFIRVGISVAVLFIYSVALKPQLYRHKLFLSTLAILLVGAADLLVVSVLSMLTGATVEALVSTRLLRIQGTLASKSILLVLFFILTRQRYDRSVTGPLWPLLYCIPVVSITLLFIFMQYQVNSHSESNTLFAITVGFTFISFATVFLYDKLAELMQKSFQESLMAQQLDALESHIREMQRISEETRGLRHDMSNHMQALHGLIEDENYDEALAYIAHIESTQSSQRLRVNTGHPAVDAIVGSKISYAQSLGISTDYYVSLPSPIKIPAMELCAVLGNLLDNAIEASRLVTNDPSLRIEVKVKADQIIIIVENRWLPPKGPLVSSKGRGHGIGLLNVRRIVERIGGLFEIDAQQTIFIVRVLIPN